MKWITGEHITVDGVAASWLIKTSVDPRAEFLFLPDAELLASAERAGATPFAATRWPEVKLCHRHHRCTFEVILEHFKVADPALHRIGHIVRAAAVNGQEHIAPEGRGCARSQRDSPRSTCRTTSDCGCSVPCMTRRTLMSARY